MRRPRVLYVSLGHPSIRPGGAESYALDLHEAIARAGEFEPILLARSGPTAPAATSHGRQHDGRPITQAGDDPSQYLFHTDPERFDFFYGTSESKTALTRFYSEFLLQHRPDIVHFHHTLFFGYDMIRATRNMLPDASIVHSLHEYLPICHRDGQMVRTRDNELCRKESPRRCHECFPEISEPDFFMRKSFIQSHFALVDLFIAPSPWTLERYVDWGIARERIRLEPQGIVPSPPQPDTRDGDRRRNRLGFFGQLTPYKGADVLLEAMAILGEDFGGHLWVNGANLESAPAGFRERLEGLLEKTNATVTFAGPYPRPDVARLMASVDWVVVPSIWWETGPLTVSEAFMQGRPVICSNIGGMSEKVADGVSGLHFRRGDPHDLAEVIDRAVTSRRLWGELRAGIPPVYAIDAHVAKMSGFYRELLARPRGAGPGGERLERAISGA